MTQKSDLKLFDSKKVRTVWDDEQEKWYFSIVDVIEILTDSPRARKYWNALKSKLIDEGSELSQFLGQLKMPSSDGKMYMTDVADSEQLFRLIQLTEEWKKRGMKEGVQFATLTDIITETWAGKTTKDISQVVKPMTFDDNKKVAIKGGNVAKVARKELEANTGKAVVSSLNAKTMRKQLIKSSGDDSILNE